MKMNIEKSTPIPWTLIDADYNGITTITGGENPNAQQLIFEPCRMEQANAALIVESVNQHAALVAVAEAAWLFIQWIPIEAAEKFGADLEYGDLKQALLSLKSIRKEEK